VLSADDRDNRLLHKAVFSAVADFHERHIETAIGHSDRLKPDKFVSYKQGGGQMNKRDDLREDSESSLICWR